MIYLVWFRASSPRLTCLPTTFLFTTSFLLKARKILGLIYRCFYTSSNQEVLKQLYVSLVRPYLEYACQVWDTHLTKDKKLLEDVQKFDYKLAAHQWDSSYQDLLQLFELQTLEERRLHLKLGLMFKIINNLCYFPSIPAFRSTLPGLRTSHPLQFNPPLVHTNDYKFSFFPHTMSICLEFVEQWVCHLYVKPTIYEITKKHYIMYCNCACKYVIHFISCNCVNLFLCHSRYFWVHLTLVYVYYCVFIALNAWIMIMYAHTWVQWHSHCKWVISVGLALAHPNP